MSGPTLSATLEARLDQFQQQLSQAGDMADQAVTRITQSFEGLNPTINTSGLGTGIAAGLGLGVAVDAAAKLWDWLKQANQQMATMDTVATTIALSLKDLQTVQFAGALQGISSSDVQSGLTKMATQLDAASRGANDLSKILDANDITWKDTNDKVITLNQLLPIAASLVAKAANPIQANKIADMLGLSEKWVPVLQQIAAQGFDGVADAAQKAGVIIDDDTIQKAAQFQQEWNKASAQWKVEMEAALVGVLPFIENLISKAKEFVATIENSDIGQGMLKSFQQTNDQMSGIGAQVQKIIDDLRNNATADQTNKDIMSFLLGPSQPGIGDWLGTQADKVDAAAGRITVALQSIARYVVNGQTGTAAQAALNPSPTKLTKDDDDDASKRFDTMNNVIERHIALLDADKTAVGLNAGAQEQLKAELQLLNAAHEDNDDITTKQIDTYTTLRATMSAQQAIEKAGIDLDSDKVQKLIALTQRAGEAAQAAAQAKASFQASNQALQFGGDQIITAFDGIRTGSLTAAAAVNQLTNALITALEKALLLGEGPLAGLLGTSAAPGSGGTGGLLGNLFHLAGNSAASGSSAATGTALSSGGGFSLPGFAGGTDSAPGGPALVGEDGPEIVNLPRGAQVVPSSVSRALNGGGGGAINVRLNVVNNVGAQVSAGQAQPDGQGGFSLDVALDKAVASKMAKPGSFTNNALSQRFGVQQQPVRR